MGCTGSKLDDLPAVALCRERCAFLDEAIKKRYGLAGAHLAYIHSLRQLGVSLHRFFDQDLVNSTAGPPSPVLNLPPKRKGDPEPSGSVAAAPAIHHSHSHSHSGSHLNFNSESEDDDSASGSLHLHSDNTTPVHPYSNYGYADHETLGSYQGGGFINMNYMRNKATPSVVYEQRPMSPETVHMAESSSYNPYPYANQNPGPYSYSGYPNYGSNYGGGFYGSSPPPPYGYSAPQQPQLSASSMASSSKPPPPPPSPPRGSTWDFLNPFEVVERYYPQYTPSRDSREVREEEGIPDLEDEDYQQEIVKEVHGHQKFVDGGGGKSGGGGAGGSNYSKALANDEGKKASVSSENHYHTRPSVSMEDDDAVEYEVHVVEKKVVDKEDRPGDRQAAGGGGFRNDSEVVKEIQVQFERASDSGNDLAKMLEVGKLPYNKKHGGGYLVASKMLHASLPMVTSTSIENADLDTNDDLELRSGGLSSTLQKLHLWEKKLYEEVKVEEKMRILHERKLRRLKRLDEKGAEPHKVDTTRSLVRSLSTKIRISIQVVDKISVKINKVRDEDLWPQLKEFIQGLARMWKSMLECHHNQSRAMAEARRLDAITSHKHMGDAHREATKHLALELLKWISRFSDWVIYQKDFIKSLNSWLLKCLLYEPEETPDGIVPFSPGRIGAPPVFIICNQWSQALDQVSEREVVDAMRDFAVRVLQIWERDKLETQQGIKDSERRVKSVVDREEVNIQKEIQALEKRMVVVENGLALNGQAVYQSDTSKSTSLQVSLQRFFEAMERFTASSLKVCEELLQRIEEDKLDDQQEPSETETV